jgi:UDP-4-amino-4-deoxy-L-arabinose-oxoglutarate aminotransferase
MVDEPFLPLARPPIVAGEESAVLAVLESGWLTTEPKVQELHRAFAQSVHSRNAIVWFGFVA